MREAGTLMKSVDGDSSGAEYLHFRELIIGPEREELDALKKRVKVMDAQLEKRVGDVVPKALAARLRGNRVAEDEMGEILHGSVESALRISVERDRSKLTHALFPVMGPAIRDYVRNLFQTKMEELNALIRNTTSLKRLKWKVQALLTGRPFSEVLFAKTLKYRVDEVFLIQRDSGLLMRMVAATDEETESEEVAAMQVLRVGEHEIFIHYGPRAILAAMVRGRGPEAIQEELRGILEDIHANQERELADFNGNMETTEFAQPYLERALLEQRVEAGRGGSWPAWLMVGVLGMALVYGVFWKWNDVQKWRGFARALGDEPGIEAVEFRREIGRRVVSGLRDPLAVRPETIAMRRGIVATEVEFRLEPFHSLEPRFAGAREEALEDRFEQVRRDEERRTGEQIAEVKREIRMLAEAYLRSRFGGIDGMELAIDRGVVIANEDVAEPEYSMVNRELPVFGKVLGEVDVTGLVNKTEVSVARLTEDLSGMRFLFESGSPDFVEGTPGIVKEVALLFSELMAEAELLGKRAEIEIHGLPMSGTNREYLKATTNRRLEELHALLTSAGVPEAAILKTIVDPDEGGDRANGVAFLKVSVR